MAALNRGFTKARKWLSTKDSLVYSIYHLPERVLAKLAERGASPAGSRLNRLLIYTGSNGLWMYLKVNLLIRYIVQLVVIFEIPAESRVVRSR